MTQDQALQLAKDHILKDGAVAMPTETVYGLAASIYSEEGLKKIFSLKDRPFFDPLIVHISDWNQRSLVVREWPAAADHLAKAFWPGPLTLVLPKQQSINPLITAGLDTVGIRMPSHPLARQLIALVEAPLAAPSANKFGKTSPTKADHVRRSFPKEDLFIIDGGPSEVGLESTVIKIDQQGENTIIKILRPGFITDEQIKTTLAKAGIIAEVSRATSQESPGHTPQHYMPNLPLIIIEGQAKRLPEAILKKVCADFHFTDTPRGTELLLDSNAKLAARALYGRLRESSAQSTDFLYVFLTPERTGGVWDAIWDRLNRAASARYRI